MVLNWLKSKLSLYALISLYVIAGLNHFIFPSFYLPLIPYDHPSPSSLNVIVGLLELSFGLLLLIPGRSRKYAAYAIIALLCIFIPVHIVFIREGGCFEGYFCVPSWVAHLRLWIVHPLLIYWVWVQRYNRVKLI